MARLVPEIAVEWWWAGWRALETAADIVGSQLAPPELAAAMAVQAGVGDLILLATAFTFARFSDRRAPPGDPGGERTTPPCFRQAYFRQGSLSEVSFRRDWGRGLRNPLNALIERFEQSQFEVS